MQAMFCFILLFWRVLALLRPPVCARHGWDRDWDVLFCCRSTIGRRGIRPNVAGRTFSAVRLLSLTLQFILFLFFATVARFIFVYFVFEEVVPQLWRNDRVFSRSSMGDVAEVVVVETWFYAFVFSFCSLYIFKLPQEGQRSLQLNIWLGECSVRIVARQYNGNSSLCLIVCATLLSTHSMRWFL